MKNREELIKELKLMSLATIRDCEIIADFIIKDRHRICEPLIKLGENNHIGELGNTPITLLFAINETIRIAGLEQ